MSSIHHTIIQKTLANQISLVMIPLPGTAAVTATVLMGVGSRYESDTQQGLAHFTEHMVFKGGRKYTDAQSIAQALDAVGGEFNAYTSQEYTGFYTKTAAQHLSLGLDVLSDMVLHASLPEDELEKEKGVIVEEINMYEDMPMRKVDQVLMELVFGESSPLGRPIIGTKQSVTRFSREDFLKYREQFYMGAKCTVVIAGSLDPEETTALVEKYFAELPQGDDYKALPGVYIDRQDKVKIEYKKSEQTHLMLASKAYSLVHSDRYAYRMLVTILGGNMSSRLFVSVREKQGLCYYVRAIPDMYLDTGMLVASAGVDNARLEQAVAAIMRELQSLRSEVVSEKELDRAKQFLLGKMLLTMEDSEQVAEIYGMQQLLEGAVETTESIEKKILAITPEDIQRVAKDILVEEHLRLAIIGPHKDTEKLEKLLTFS